MQVLVDIGTVEQRKRILIDRELTTAGGAKGARVKHECRLDWYWSRALLDDPQHTAGLRFRNDWEIGVVSTGVIGTYEQIITGDRDFTEAQTAARRRLKGAHGALGAIPFSIVLDVCAYDKWASEWERARGWPHKSGTVLLREALQELAKHYRLIDRGGRSC
jgi:hypothetical protein